MLFFPIEGLTRDTDKPGLRAAIWIMEIMETEVSVRRWVAPVFVLQQTWCCRHLVPYVRVWIFANLVSDMISIFRIKIRFLCSAKCPTVKFSDYCLRQTALLHCCWFMDHNCRAPGQRGSWLSSLLVMIRLWWLNLDESSISKLTVKRSYLLTCRSRFFIFKCALAYFITASYDCNIINW